MLGREREREREILKTMQPKLYLRVKEGSPLNHQVPTPTISFTL